MACVHANIGQGTRVAGKAGWGTDSLKDTQGLWRKGVCSRSQMWSLNRHGKSQPPEIKQNGEEHLGLDFKSHELLPWLINYETRKPSRGEHKTALASVSQDNHWCHLPSHTPEFSCFWRENWVIQENDPIAKQLESASLVTEKPIRGVAVGG